MNILLHEDTSTTQEHGKGEPPLNKTSNRRRSSSVNTSGDGQPSMADSDASGRDLRQQYAQEDRITALADQETVSQDPLRELEAYKIRLASSEREHRSTERKLANSISECDFLRIRLKTYDQVTDMFNTMADLHDVEDGEIVEALAQLRINNRRPNPLLRWLHTQKATYWKRKAVAAEDRLKIYAEVDYPAQVRAAQKEIRMTNKRNEDLVSKLSATEADLQMMQPEIDQVQRLEGEVGYYEEKIEELEYEVSQLKDSKTALLEKLELARTEGGSTEQAVLRRLDTVLLRRLEPTGPESMLQALVDKQRITLDNTQKELGTTKQHHTNAQRELKEAKQSLKKSESEFAAFKQGIATAIGWWYYRGTSTHAEQIVKMRDELAALKLSLKSVDGDSNLVKVEVLKTACEDLDTTSKELEVVRTERDGIYKTLNVSGCLGAHLTIGDLKLAQLECEILRKAIGDFEDEEAVREIRRLKKANVELIKVESALDGCAGDSNVAKIDTLKAACEKK
jgi:predicted  nucleic acid-binding Zn-ribbon protein